MGFTKSQCRAGGRSAADARDRAKNLRLIRERDEAARRVLLTDAERANEDAVSAGIRAVSAAIVARPQWFLPGGSMRPGCEQPFLAMTRIAHAAAQAAFIAGADVVSTVESVFNGQSF
jgi:hypothetical protein